jgi:DNA-binding transcriptional regulator YdaS (Cro superfamily)
MNDTAKSLAIEALNKAITIAGSQTKLAEKLKITPQAVQQWLVGGRYVPVKRASEIERLTGVKREQLRPDIFQ